MTATRSPRCSATASRRCAIVALLASPVIPHAAGELWRRLGLAGAPEDQRLPDAAVWGSADTAGNALEKGARSSPASTVRDRPEPDVGRQPLPPARGPGRADPILDRARAGGVDWAVCVGTDLATSRAAIALAERHDDVHATVGLHPHDAARLDAEWDELVALAARPEVVGIGEAGFDLHYNHSPFADQEAAFRAQIQLAHETGQALVIHSRKRGTTRSACSRRSVCPCTRCSTASPVAPMKRAARSTSAPTSRSAAS